MTAYHRWNSTSKRSSRTEESHLLETARTLFLSAKLPRFMREEGVRTANHVINRSPTTAHSVVTLYERDNMVHRARSRGTATELEPLKDFERLRVTVAPQWKTHRTRKWTFFLDRTRSERERLLKQEPPQCPKNIIIQLLKAKLQLSGMEMWGCLNEPQQLYKVKRSNCRHRQSGDLVEWATHIAAEFASRVDNIYSDQTVWMTVAATKAVGAIFGHYAPEDDFESEGINELLDPLRQRLVDEALAFVCSYIAHSEWAMKVEEGVAESVALKEYKEWKARSGRASSRRCAIICSIHWLARSGLLVTRQTEG